MMKNSMKSSLLLAALGIGAASCAPDWGQKDPPAGNQVYPSLQNVATYTFEDDQDPLAVDLGGPATIAMDDSVKSMALCIERGGTATLANALAGVDCQKAASVSFWYKQLPTDATGTLDRTSPILHWEMDGKTLDFSADGQLRYYNAYESITGHATPADDNDLIKADRWQFVTLVVGPDSYSLYIDGEEMPTSCPEGTDLSGAVVLMNHANQVNVNPLATHRMLLDDFTFFRNFATAKEARRPKKGNLGQSGGQGSEGPDYSKWILTGEEDNSSGFWTAWSPYVNLEGDGTIHYDFINNCDEAENWRNWMLCLTNGVERGGDGYMEYAVMRADAWGWASLWETGEISHDYDWDTFKHDMNGAFVSMDINRNGSQVEMTATTTTKDGREFHYRKTIEGVDSQKLGSFLFVEGCHLLIDPEAVFTGKVYKPGEYKLGTDFTTGFWTTWGKQARMTGNFKNFCFEFINHSPGAGAANWHTWGLIVTNGYQSGGNDPDYKEHYYLRADAYGWGEAYERSTMTHGFDWDTYTADMKDARVKMLFSYSNQELTMTARQTKADGDEMPEYRFVTPGIPTPLSLILTCEGCWLEILKEGYYPFAAE